MCGRNVLVSFASAFVWYVASIITPLRRNKYALSVNPCLSPYVVDCSPQAAGPPSLWRARQLRQTPAGMLFLMPTGRSRALGSQVFHACLSMCMPYCLENFIYTQGRNKSMPDCSQEHWPLFTCNSFPPTVCLSCSAPKETKHNIYKRHKSLQVRKERMTTDSLLYEDLLINKVSKNPLILCSQMGMMGI